MALTGSLAIEGAFAPSLLERLRAEMAAAGGEAATVSGIGGDRALVTSARRATVVEVPDALRAEVQDVLERLRPLMAEHFGRRLDAVEEPQFLRYRTGDYFVAHQDGNTPLIHDDTRFRQVTVVIFMSEQSDDGHAATYRGGSLVLHGGRDDPDGRVPLAPAPGTLVAFPAETTHEVTPVLAGERLSVVAWYRRKP